MQAKKDSTKIFAEKTGDRLFIEMEISGDPDQAISDLMKSIKNNEELMPNLKVSQILFKGKNMNATIEQAKLRLIEAMKDEVANFNNDFKTD